MNIAKKLVLWLLSIKNLFVRNKKRSGVQKKIDYDEDVSEIWQTNFNSKDVDARFEAEEGDGYRAFFDTLHNQSVFCLELQRRNLYAWVENKFFRYKDFILEALISPMERFHTKCEKSNASSQKSCDKNVEMAGSYSFGFIFRNIGRAFYSILVSNEGMVRLDVVINNMPKTLCPWISLDNLSSEIKITIIALGSSITLLVDDEWVARVKDDSIDAAGKIAFAMQNYKDVPCVSSVLKKISIDSRSFEVEKKHDEAKKIITKKARARLCKAYYNIGNFSYAMSEIKEIEKIGMEVEDCLIAGDICSSLKMTEKAEAYFLNAIKMKQKILMQDLGKDEGILFEKDAMYDGINDGICCEVFIRLAYLYYNSLQYKKLKDLLEKIGDKKIEDSPALCKIKAHYLSYEGDYIKAIELYKKASELEPKDASSFLMVASSYEILGKKDEASLFYIKAGNLFLEEGFYVELGKVLTSLEHLNVRDERYMALNAKFYYGTNQKEKAYEICKKITSGGEASSDIWYLYGSLLEELGEEGAQYAFMRAYNGEPSNSSYAYALAKSLYLSKKECEPYIIEALKGDEMRGEAYNLYACFMVDKKDMERGEEYIEKARELLPSDLDVLQNYLYIKRLRGKLKETYHLFGIGSSHILDEAVERDRGGAYHIFGRELDLDGNRELAYEMYHNALKLQKENSDLYYDIAKNALTLGYLVEARDMAIKALEIKALPTYYVLLATIAKEMGEYSKCEAIVSEGFKKKIFDESAVLELIYLYLSMGKKEKAKELLHALDAMPYAKNVLSLEIKKELENIIGS